MATLPLWVTYLGHATLLIEMAGLRLLTDPLLRRRVAHLRRRAPPVPPAACQDIDAVLISHLHLDHLDLPSLARIDPSAPRIVPRGAGGLIQRQGAELVQEMDVGDSIQIGPLEIRAVYARHDGRRPPQGPRAPALGFLLREDYQVYFPGDTDVFAEMETLAPDLDLAFLPVWGWGPTLGDGHMDPERAAEALALLRPKMAIPIHWGTFYPIGLGWFKPFLLTNPPISFIKHARKLAPEVDVRILQPGESTAVTF